MARLLALRSHPATECLDNVALGILRGGFELLTRGLHVAIYAALPVVVSPLPGHAASTWLMALLGYDFLFYWAHRVHHASGLLWATHAVHHQATKMNVTVGLRTALTNSAAHLPFFLPLALLGVPVSVYAGVALIHLLAMTWLHLETRVSVGWLERVINTPALHGLHHSADPRHHDKNFGGLLIIYDRLFGTYAAPEPIAAYGVGDTRAPGPVEAHLRPYRRLAQRLRQTPGWLAKLRQL